MSKDSKDSKGSNAQQYWKANTNLITTLLIIWGVVSLGFGILLAPALNNIYLGQLPLGFWFAQQGAMIVFVILIFVYAWQMDKIDQKYGMQDEGEEQ